MVVRIINADVLAGLAELPDESVHCVVTSPPYWGLRDYGQPGQIGLEATPEAFVARMVEVFSEVRRVLRKDGTCWVNLGDSYAMSTKGSSGKGEKQITNAGTILADRSWRIPDGLKQKDLCGIPWRVALALQADGWWLRSDIIWNKPNPMPESVTDRPTKSHEYLFLLTKAATYYYDADAIREPHSENAHHGLTMSRASAFKKQAGVGGHGKGAAMIELDPAGRNARSVWTIATAPFAEAHFATFPPELPAKCIKAGTSEKGCCAKCGAPWEREVDKERTLAGNSARAGRSLDDLNSTGKHRLDGATGNKNLKGGPVVSTTTLGWSPSCSCDVPAIPCTVLDPFGGAGTTALVADRLQRNAVLIELNPEYAAMAEKRIFRDAGGLFAEVGVAAVAPSPPTQLSLLEAAE
jgi:DNA modification methylase